MVKHTQIIRRPKPRDCLNVFNYFVGLVLKGLKTEKKSKVKHLNSKTDKLKLNKIGWITSTIIVNEDLPRNKKSQLISLCNRKLKPVYLNKPKYISTLSFMGKSKLLRKLLTSVNLFGKKN